MDWGIRSDGEKTFCRKVTFFSQQKIRRRVQFLKGEVRAA